MTIRVLKKSLVVLSLSISVGMFISSLYLFYLYHDGHLPNSPQPTIGRVYPSNNHGSVVYLTRSENNLLKFLQFGGMIPFLVGFILNRRWRVFIDPLEGLSHKERYKVLHGPYLDYDKVRETYKTKDQ